MKAVEEIGNTVLVLGATGGIGGEVARQLRDAGWQVRALKRGQVETGVKRDGITWLRGDAMNRREVMQAARGCEVIAHMVNPPGYRKWAELVLPMLDNSLAAAVEQRATVLIAGSVYNYGPDALPEPAEDSPQHPVTRKGAIRVDVERHLREAVDQGARALVVRAGDFFGPRAGNNWFAQGLVKPGRPVKTIKLPGEPGVGHQWAYLPDLARTMVELLARRDVLAAYESFHTRGHWDQDGRQMAEAIRRVVATHGGQADIGRFPWWLARLASPFVATLREVLEMRYLWEQPVRLDNARLVSLLGHEPHTPLDEAVEATLIGLGCLPPAGTSA